MARNNRLKFYRDNSNEFRWKLVAPNGRILDASSESFKRRQGCLGNAVRVAQAFSGDLSNIEITDETTPGKSVEMTGEEVYSSSGVKS